MEKLKEKIQENLDENVSFSLSYGDQQELVIKLDEVYTFFSLKIGKAVKIFNYLCTSKDKRSFLINLSLCASK
jgi:deoxyhypusine synthase